LEACKALYQINLSVNASKVALYGSREAFDEYWAFEIFDMLADGSDRDRIRAAAETYLFWSDQGKVFRRESVLKRLLAVGLDGIQETARLRLLGELHAPEYLVQADYRQLTSIHRNSPDPNRLFALLDQMIPEVQFNSYHFNLLKFYERVRPARSRDDILARVADLRVIRRAV
jgi:hypothetical protein